MRYSFPKGQSGNPSGRPQGAIGKRTREVRDLARRIIESPTYLKNLKARLNNGTSPHMEPVLFYYAYGKPIDSVAPVNPDGTAYEQVETLKRLSHSLQTSASYSDEKRLIRTAVDSLTEEESGAFREPTRAEN